MILLPIDLDESKNSRFRSNPACLEILNVYPDYYNRVGYNPPWIGYFATIDGEILVGAGGYKGRPKDGMVEIAYGTFEEFEGKGIGTGICRQLVELSLRTDPSIRITARTLTDSGASAQILKRNGFIALGLVMDPEDGEVWEWKWQQPE